MLDFYHFRHFSKCTNLRHSVTTKNPLEPYHFSLALHTGENASDIITNREKLEKAFSDNPLHYITANQTHSDHIYIATKSETLGWNNRKESIPDCDALITNLPNIALTILTADCVPILVFDPVTQTIAAVHAGWKGTKKKILSKTVKKMINVFDSNPRDILVGLGPSIGKCCYEVGDDVAKYFQHLPYAYTAKKSDKYMLDLPTINKQQLIEVGIEEKNIEMSNICTACEVDRFFSYRKENGCTGRFMSMILYEG